VKLCTRRCGFCAVAPGKPNGFVDWDEPRRVAEAVAGMNLRHTVITSVARDDLKDGGSTIFAMVIQEIRKRSGTVVEVLIPDFRGSAEDLQRVIDARPEVINHNIETVARLHPVVRPSARYDRAARAAQARQGLRHGDQGQEREHHGRPRRDRRRV
jgi:lipoic acid synthetase